MRKQSFVVSGFLGDSDGLEECHSMVEVEDHGMKWLQL